MNEPVLFEAYLDILWHSLGMSAKNRRRSLEWWLDNDNHRNHFCRALVDPEYGDLLEELIRRGWMTRGRTINDGRDCYYHVTPEGIRIARENFPRPARKSAVKEKE